MLDFKTLKNLNQYNIKSVRVYSDGIFQLEYGQYGPYFYPDGQMIPHTDEIVMKPHMNSFIRNNTIRYSVAMVEDGEDVWYWSFYDLTGKKLADKMAGDHDGPDNYDGIPRPVRPAYIPQMSYNATDKKMPQPTLKTNAQKIADIAGVYWFIDGAKFYQIPAFRNMLDGQYLQLVKYIAEQPQIGVIESEYLSQYLDYMSTMDGGNRDRYNQLKNRLTTVAHNVKTR